MRQNNTNFDYIIIGGGSAGCVLANRLSEDPTISVCLLEAGPDDNSSFIHNCNPLNMLYLMNSRKYNWLYKTEAETKTGGRKFFWPRGKVLGGSSAINAMIYTRGHRSDFDHWADLGNTGWDYDSVLPWFKISERQARGGDEFHGTEGDMDVVDPNFHFPASKAFIEAAIQAGIPHNKDLNGSSYGGVDFFQTTQTPDGKRCHSTVSHLNPARSRSNLSIVTYAAVKKITFENKTANGVEYIDLKRGKKINQLTAGREVILCAGVIASPQILKLSGVGPSQELSDLNIDVVHNLPGVGENLQDHPDVILRCLDKSKSSLTVAPKGYMVKFLRRFYQNKEPFVFTPTDAGGFVKSAPEVTVPDLQLQFASVRMKPHGSGLFTPTRSGFVLHVCHMHPNSRGRVTLKSNNPLKAPRIAANYFSDDMELDAMVKGVKIARHILSQKAMQEFVKKEEVPGAGVETDAEIREFILQKVESVYHTAGSCKMGVDDMSVVDPELKVHGLKNLRVIDSSIMPTITGSNIHGPTIMIAEKGADMILNA